MIHTAAFFDELEKIAQEDDRITKQKAKRLLRYGAAGAAGIGVGYATGKLVGKPLQKKVLTWAMKNPTKAGKLVRYGVPTSAGLGAALMLARKKMGDELGKKIKKDDNS